MKEVALAAIEASSGAEKRASVLAAQYKNELDKIRPSQQKQLLGKVRTQLIEVTRPTIKSASYVSLGEPSDIPIMYMDLRDAEALQGRHVDPGVTMILGQIIQYNKRTGWGKFTNRELTKPMSFLVPPLLRSEALGDILDSMTQNADIAVNFTLVRDATNNVLYGIFEGFFDLDQRA
jgi:hypothetical protein